MKHRLLSILVATCLALPGFSAINYVLNESFEEGIPSTWEQQVVNTSAGGAWISENTSLSSPTGAYDGEGRAALRSESGNVGYCVRLVTPVLDLSEVSTPLVSFAYAQPRKGNSTLGFLCDTLSVYIRPNSTADWVLIKKYSEYQNDWSLQTLELPVAGKTATCQLAFEAKENGGYGVLLDRVRVYPQSQCLDASITGVTVGADAALISWEARAGRAFELIVSASAIADLASYNTSEAVFYSNTLSGVNKVVSGLTSGTHYYVYLRTDCDDNESGHTAWVSTEFTTALSLPYTPVLASFPSTWTQKQGDVAPSVANGDLTDNTTSYKWSETTNTSVFGAAHAYAQNSTKPSWALTPSIDMSGATEGQNILLSFRLAITSGSSSATASSYASASKFHVFAMANGSDEWNLVRTINGSELTAAGRIYNILLDDYKESGSIRLAFVAEAASSSAYFHFFDMSVAESDGTCLGLYGLTAVSTTDAVNLSWSVIGKTNNANALISTKADLSDILESKAVTSPSASFSGLTSGTTYYVGVSQDCPGADTLIAKVTTAFPMPFSEDFNSLTSGIPAGWDNSEGTTSDASYKWAYYATGHDGTCVRFNSFSNSSNKTNFLATPAIFLTADAELSFWWKNPAGGAGEVLVSVDGGANKTSLLNTGLTGVSEWTKFTIDLSAYTGKSVIIYFKGTSNCGWGDAYLYLDDVKIDAIPDCKQVKDVAVGSITSNSAEVSFTENGAAEYDVLVVTKQMNPDTLTVASLIAFRDTVTAGPVAVSNLEPSTQYYVYARALCGGEERGEWSGVKAFATECDEVVIAKGSPWKEGFEDYAASANPDCWTIVRAGGSYPYVVSGSSYSHESTKAFTWGTSYSYSTQYKSFAILPKISNAINTLELDFYIKSSSTYYDSDILLVGVVAAPNDTASFEQVVTFTPSSSSYTLQHVDFSSYAGSGKYIAFVRVPVGEYDEYDYETYYSPFSIDDIKVGVIPTCDRLGAVELVSTTASSATLRFAATNASQYQVVLATESINPDTLANVAPAAIAYNDMVSSTQPTISSLDGNTRYYAYVRGFCGGDDYSEWTKALMFKTQCTAITPAAFGLETFLDPSSADCWTFGFSTVGSSSSYAYAKRDSVKAYGGYIKLSKESVAYTKNAAGVDTVYSDGAYAISPELDVDDIRNYQVSFTAVTTSTATTNYKRLNIGLVTNPSDLSTLEILKTINLDYAADSTELKSYAVSFANAEGDFDGNFGKYVIFQLNEAVKHDSTNYALIDNVSFELASNCQQVIEAAVDSVGINGARISWENTGADSYKVMVATINSLRPDTITAPVFTSEVSTLKAELTGLESNTRYFAYVRGICGASDSAKWSNAAAFRTSIGIPYNEPFTVTSLSEGWQSLYGNFSNDSILTSALSAPTGEYKWSMKTTGLPTGMTAPAAYGYIDDFYSGYPWLISPAIDLVGHEADFIELTFSVARSITTSSKAKFYVVISENGGLTWKKANAITWMDGGDYDFNNLTTTPTSITVNLTKYAGKKIAVAFYMQSPFGSTHIYHGLYIDDVSVHTYEAVCRGVEQLQVVPSTQSAKVTWSIEGTPDKAAVEIYSDATFETRIDSVGIEGAFEHTFSGLTSNTTYYVRVKQLECADAEWITESFTTECDALTSFPWSENFDNYEAGDFSSDCWVNKHVDGSGESIFQIATSTQGTNDTKQLKLPDMSSGTKTLLALPRMTLDEADAYQFKLDVYRNSSTADYQEGLRIYASLAGDLDSTATELAFISRSYKTTDTAANIIPAETASGWYTYALNIPLQGDVRIFIQGESKYGSATYSDNFIVRHKPACPDMSGLAVDSIVADSARLFVDNLGAAGYHFVVATAEVDLNNLSEADAAKIIVNDSVYGSTVLHVAGLNPATTYYAYARTLCDDNKVGAWGSPISFVSACGVITVADGSPFIENFTSLKSGIPVCWDNSRGTVSDSYKWSYYASGYEGACVRFNSFDPSSGKTDTLVMPEIHLAEDAILSFYWKNPDGGAAAVLISADGGATFTTLESALTSKSSWTLFEKDLSAYTGQTVQIYFASTSNCGYGDAYHYLDNVKIGAIPACSPISGLAAKLTPGDGTIASLSWDMDTVAGWKIQYATAADFSNAVDTAVSDTSFIALSGLTPETTYYARVKNVCDGGAESEWSDAINFMPTNALSMTVNDGSSTNNKVPIYGSWVDNKSYSQFIIPADSLVALQWDSIKQLTFYSSNASIDWGAAKFEVYMAEVPSASISALADWTSLTKVKNAGSLSIVDNQMVVSLDALYQYQGGNLLIGFKQTVSGSYKSCSWYGKSATGASMGGYGTSVSQENFLPKMTIGYVPGVEPACIKPTGLAAELTPGDGTIASLSWDMDTVAGWKIQYATAADFSNAVDTTVSDTSFIALSGLTPETMYYARVKNVCDGSAESEWSDAISFIPTNTLSMTVNDGSSTNDIVPIDGYNVDNKSYSQFIIPADSLVALQWDSIKQLRFYSSNASIDWGSAQFEVYVAEVPSASISALADWTSLTKVKNAGSLSIVDNQMVVSLDALYQYQGGNLLIGFKQTVSGSYKSCSWYGKSATGASMGGYGTTISQQNFLPKMTIGYVPGVEPACIKPSGLTVSNVSAISAEVGFKAAKASEYDLVLTNAAINPDTLLLVADSIVVWRDTVDTNRVAINGLQQQTDYYVYVRSLCSATEVSEWISSEFTTLCLASVPFVENFDDELNRKAVYAGTSSYTIPTCWTEGYDDKSYVSYIQDNTSYSSYSYSGNSALRLYSYYSSYYGEIMNKSYVVLPELDASLDTLQLSFKARAMSDGSSVSNYATSSYAHSVKIGTMTDPTDLSTFQLIDTYVLTEVPSTPSSADGYWEDVVIYLQGATGKFIALVSDFGEKSNYVWIDDVEVSKAPDCLAPSTINVIAGARSADVTWASIAENFEVALGAAGFALPAGADTIFAVADTTGLHITDLSPSSDYDLYVRAVCGENAPSEWSKLASFSTLCMLPDFAEYHFDDASTRYFHHRDSLYYYDYYDEGSEGAARYMENCWTIEGSMYENSYYEDYYEEYTKTGYYPRIYENEGNTVFAHSGTGAVGFKYSSSESTKPLSAVMAAMETLDRDSLQLEFWGRPGYANGSSLTGASNSYARMLRVGLMTDPSDLTTFVPLSTIQSEAISGDPSADLDGENYWRRYVINLAGTTAPFIAFVYDSTASNLFFIDDVRIKKMATCGEPMTPQIVNITDSSAVVRWDTVAPAYQVALIRGTDTVKTLVEGLDTLLLNNLLAATSYIVKIQALCSATDSSEWSASAAFTTDCSPITTLPWSENFDGLTIPSEYTPTERRLPICWSAINTCTYSSYKNYPTAYYYSSTNYANSEPNSLRFYSSYSSYSNYDPQDQYAILPEIEGVSSARLRLSARAYSTSYDATFTVGVMTNPSDASTFVPVKTISPTLTTYEQYTIMLNECIGSGKFIAIKMAAANSNVSTRSVHIDDIQIEEVDLNCLGVENLVISNISGNGAQANFRFIDGLDHDAHVAISREAAYDPSTVLFEDTVSDSSYVFNVALEYKATYYIYVRQACGENHFSEWVSASFSTPYAIRYEAEFSSTTLPDEWAKYSGSVDDVIAGTAQLTTSSYGWSLTAADTVVNATHFRGNVFGTSFNYWMVSPLVSLTAPAGSNVQLHFEAGLTPYSRSSDDILNRNAGVDDRFAVLITTDMGATWTKLREWNNTGSQDVYNDIPEHAQTIKVDLADYVGQTVQVAFYGESTEDNADNYFHFGNIVINRLVEENYEVTICDGSDYSGHGFSIAAEDYQKGANVFDKYIPAVNGSAQPDSLLTLNLTVMESSVFEDSVVLCEGERFIQTIHGYLFDFTATVGMNDRIGFVTSEFGCDDAVKLKVTVHPSVEVHVYDSVAQGDEYIWHGQAYISATTAQFDTVSLVTGCDSTTVLHLSVYQEEQAIHSVTSQSLLIAPNPVKKGEPIHVLTSFTAAELREAKVEIISAAGSLFYTQQGAEDPFVLPGIPVSGVYIVRVIVGDEIFISSLLVH